MYSNIIVGYGGGDEGAEALALAEALRADGGTITPIRLAGDPDDPQELHRHMSESGADLLVVGSSYRDQIGMTLTRTAGRALLCGSRCPVAVAPSGFRAGATAGPRVIAVALENEDEGLHAVDEAVRLAGSAPVELRLLCLVPPLAQWVRGAGSEAGYGPGDVERHHLRPFAQMLDRAVDAIPPGVSIEARMLEGPPAPTLLQELRFGVDLLVMASPGVRPIASVRPGATALAAMSRSPCPVLLTPTGVRATSPR